MDTFFTCDVNGCQRQFVSTQALNAHLEKVHGVAPDGSPMSAPGATVD